MARFPNSLSDQAAPCNVGPGWHMPIAPRVEYRTRQEVECALDFAAQYFLSELLLPYPSHFWL